MLMDDKINNFFNQLDTLIGKLIPPPKGGNWHEHYKQNMPTNAPNSNHFNNYVIMY